MEEIMMPSPDRTFQPTTLAGMPLKNRIFRSATHEGLGDENGYPMPDLLRIYERLAKGQVGAIITGYTGIQSNGKAVYNMRMIHGDAYIEAYLPISARIAEYDVPLILQLVHGGGQCSPRLIGGIPVAPSAVKVRAYPVRPRALEGEEIEEIIDNFAVAIERAKQAGFSGVQLHAGHAYLLAAFLSPFLNRRTDRWGGSTENRARIMCEIIRRARQRVGDYPILVKISAYDSNKGGTSIEEGVKIVRLLAAAGCDAVEVSCGNGDGFSTVRVQDVPVDAAFKWDPRLVRMPAWRKQLLRPFARSAFRLHRPLHNYNVAAAAQIKAQVDIPVIVVGGIRSLADIEETISGGKVDYVAMARPFILQPDIVARFANGKLTESQCLDCGYCMVAVGSQPLRCYYGGLGSQV